MRKDVLVTVTGTQVNDYGEEDTITLVTTGDYYLKNSAYYIIYRESEISGMNGSTTSLKAEPARVTLNRMGTSQFKQVFQAGILHEGKYITPYGSMFVRVLPSKVEVDLAEAGGSIDLEYEIESGAQRLGHNRLSITVKEI